MELLTVVGIVSVLLSLLVPAVGHLQKSGALTTAGNLLVDSVLLARDTAAARNTFSCLVVTAPGISPQRVAVLEYRPETSEWRQVAPWASVPDTMRVEDVSAAAVRDAARTSATQLAPLDLRVAGEAVDADVSVILFRPEAGGGFLGGHRLSARYAERGSEASPTNFYDVVINPESKALRVLRP